MAMAESPNTKKAPLKDFQHGYHVVPRNERSLILHVILRQTRSKHERLVVFFSSKFSVAFHQRLLERIGVTCFAIHEEQPERKRKSQILLFRMIEGGILLCTDVVAALRLDIRDVDLVIQFDPSYKEYNHRAALIEGLKGRSLLFLNLEELPFLKYLEAASVPLKGFTIDMKSILDNHYYLEANFTLEGIADGTCSILYKQNHLEFVVLTDSLLSFYSKEAYRSYVLAYTSNAHRLDLQAVAASFGLDYTPDIERRVGEEDDELMIQMSTDWGMVMKTEWEWYLDSRKLELGKKELRKTQKRPRMAAGERRD